MMTGMMDPSWLWVLALNCLQNSMMFTPCCPRAGPTGGAGLAFPAGICNLTRVLTSFAKTCPFPLQPLDLRKPQLHRSAPAKNADEDFHPPAFLIDLVHHPVEPEERSVDNAHVVPFVKFLFLAGHPCPAVDLLAERSEEHTSELQSRFDLVCRLLLEKKKNTTANSNMYHHPHQ